MYDVFLTVAAVEVSVGAGSAVLWSQVDLGVEVLRDGGVPLLTGGLLRVERHFGTFDDDIVDFILLPPTKKHSTVSQRDAVNFGK